MRALFTFLAAIAMSVFAIAQQLPADQDHAAHHPERDAALAARPQTPTANSKSETAKPMAAKAGASSSVGAGKDTGQMHDEARKSDGMAGQMRGKGEKMMGGSMSEIPSASAASK